MSSLGKRKSSKGLFPPNPLQWDAERHGFNFRARYGLDLDEPLRPFSRELQGVSVIATREALSEYVDQPTLNLLLGEHRHKWSGMTIPCDEIHMVIVNCTHHPNRMNATLMEEYFHILLNHKPSKVSVCPKTCVLRRDYDKQIEDEAYHGAAAALVPYSPLKEMVLRDASTAEIADHFEVSTDLVDFRKKRCKLWRRR